MCVRDHLWVRRQTLTVKGKLIEIMNQAAFQRDRVRIIRKGRGQLGGRLWIFIIFIFIFKEQKVFKLPKYCSTSVAAGKQLHHMLFVYVMTRYDA